MEHTISGKPVLVVSPLNQYVLNAILDSMLQDTIKVYDYETKRILKAKSIRVAITDDILCEGDIVIVIKKGTIDENLSKEKFTPTWAGYTETMQKNPLAMLSSLSIYDAEMEEYFDVEYVCAENDGLCLVIKHDD